MNFTIYRTCHRQFLTIAWQIPKSGKQMLPAFLLTILDTSSDNLSDHCKCCYSRCDWDYWHGVSGFGCISIIILVVLSNILMIVAFRILSVCIIIATVLSITLIIVILIIIFSCIFSVCFFKITYCLFQSFCLLINLCLCYIVFICSFYCFFQRFLKCIPAFFCIIFLVQFLFQCIF